MIFMFQKDHSEDRVGNGLERGRETNEEGIKSNLRKGNDCLHERNLSENEEKQRGDV